MRKAKPITLTDSETAEKGFSISRMKDWVDIEPGSITVSGNGVLHVEIGRLIRSERFIKQLGEFSRLSDKQEDPKKA